MMESGIGAECCQLNVNTVYFPEDNIYFSFDMVLNSSVSQEKVYEDIGKATVEDVLNGYNGTIFAYGRTGTGKTYTMFGSNIHDNETKGIIPRAAMDIFKVWELSPEIKEIEVRCSMIEIYKENLNDLLTDEYTDLKIKESPIHGVYVEGLCEIPITSEEELMFYLEQGETRRAWRATRHNLVSSRSHTIFILEVKQTFNDDSSKCGKLNLVDLAGSERVGKSGLEGERFEEGTKINLSLSVLGNVIHALGKKLDYIPYRDSKLTRLLQESLGGNYKTTLIVTCSSHSSQQQETFSTLKFAQRAKKLRNKVQMNIKSSPEDLVKMTQKFKQELQLKNIEIDRLKELLMTKDSKAMFTVASEESSRAKTLTNIELREIYEGEGDSPSTIKFTESYNLLEENAKLKGKLKDTMARLEVVIKEKSELEQKVITGELMLVEEKKKTAFIEKKLIDLQRDIGTKELIEEKKKFHKEESDIELKVLKNQLKALTEAIEDCEWECFKLMKEKKEQLIKDAVTLYNLDLSEFIDKESVSTEKWIKDLNAVNLATGENLIGPKKLFANYKTLGLNAKQLMNSSKYATTINSAIADEQISTETLNYLLRIQLIDASVINHNLRRVVSSLIRKLQIERADARIKSERCKVLQKSVDSLEALLRKTSVNHQNWKDKMDKLDYEIDSLKHQLESQKHNTNSFSKARMKKPMTYILRQKLFLHKRRPSFQEDSSVRLTAEQDESQLRTERFHRNNNLLRPATVEKDSLQLEELEITLREKQIELDWHKTLTELLMSELTKTRKQTSDLRVEIEELKRSSEQAIHDEYKNWQLATTSLKVPTLNKF